MKVLFAWELGDNYGHLTKDRAIAQQLHKDGHVVDFAVRDTRIGAELLSSAGFSCVQAPLPQRTVRLTKPPVNYAEILICNGYSDRMMLSDLMRSWCMLFEQVNPNAIVIDHAPTALLAARVQGIPTLLVGNGFEIPPMINPFPPIRPWEPLSLQRLQFADNTALHTINAVLTENHRSPLAQLADLFAGSTTLFTTFSELDHYGARKKGEYVGPIGGIPHAQFVAWTNTKLRTRIFAYLRHSTPGLEALLTALQSVDAEVIAVIPDVPAALKQRFESPSLRLLPHAVLLDTLLPTANLVIVSGVGTMAEALLAGVPLLLIPEAVEQYLGGARVEALGAGIMIRMKRSAADFTVGIQCVLAEPSFKNAAKGFAHKYRNYRFGQAVEKIAARATSVANSRPTCAKETPSTPR